MKDNLCTVPFFVSFYIFTYFCIKNRIYSYSILMNIFDIVHLNVPNIVLILQYSSYGLPKKVFTLLIIGYILCLLKYQEISLIKS